MAVTFAQLHRPGHVLTRKDEGLARVESHADEDLTIGELILSDELRVIIAQVLLHGVVNVFFVLGKDHVMQPLDHVWGGDPGDIAKHALFFLLGEHIVRVHDVSLHLTLCGLDDIVGALGLIEGRQARTRADSPEQQTTHQRRTDDGPNRGHFRATAGSERFDIAGVGHGVSPIPGQSVPPTLPPQLETTRCPYSSRVAPIPYHSQRIGETVCLPPK